MKCCKCRKELTFFNKPLFGVGKLKGGQELCHSCFKGIVKIEPQLTRQLKNFTLDEIEQRFFSKDNNTPTISKVVPPYSSEKTTEPPENESDKWYSAEVSVGSCYQAKRIAPFTYGKEETVYYKSDNWIKLFGRGKDSSYFPGYGKIYNRTFNIWFQNTGSTEKLGEMEYHDIANEHLPPQFAEGITQNVFISNRLERTKGFLKLFNARDVKNNKTWYAGLKQLEYVGIITKKVEQE